MPVDGDPFEGPADAKVTIIKAYDYMCPFCDKVRPTMDELRKKYGNDLRVVYKQFVVHPQADCRPGGPWIHVGAPTGRVVKYVQGSR